MSFVSSKSSLITERVWCKLFKLIQYFKEMAPCRSASMRQIDLLLEFVEENKNMALGGLGGGPLGRQIALEKWNDITRKLNSVRPGCTKTPAEWKRYWTLLKSRSKCKAGDVRCVAIAPKCGPNNTTPLTPIEKRIIGIIGKVDVEENSKIQIPMNISDLPTESYACPEEIVVEVQPRDYHSSASIAGVENTPQWALDVESKRLESQAKIIEEIQGVKEAVQAQTIALNRIGDLLSAWMEKSTPH